MNIRTADLYEYKAAGFPVILPYERDGLPISHREVLFFDYEKIANLPIEKVPDEALAILRETPELDYEKILRMINGKINPCRAEYLRVTGQKKDMKWLFKSDASKYYFSVGLFKEMDRPDLQKAEVVYLFEIQPQTRGTEAFRIVKLETRVGVYMRPRNDEGHPRPEEAHITMGCFTRIEFDENGRLSLCSKLTRRMEDPLKDEALNENGWRFQPQHDYIGTVKSTAHFFAALRHGSDKLAAEYLGNEGTFVLRK